MVELTQRGSGSFVVLGARAKIKPDYADSGSARLDVYDDCRDDVPSPKLDRNATSAINVEMRLSRNVH
jgi:hypothetical protein